MPTYRSITIALHSQFDIETLPEYYPPLYTNGLESLSPAIAPLVDDGTSTCSVHVPVLPGSQFWIRYSVSPPVPERHYFLFKLYVDGVKAISWSTGREEEWKGKCMFGLFESSGRDGGAGEERRKVEKRVLCFGVPAQKGQVKGGCVEIRVHRASGRKRVEREMEMIEETALTNKGGGISLVNAGRAGPEQPKRFYKFALIDPVDQPFATFRYYYRTWEQLRDLGLLDQDCYAESEENSMSVIEPIEGNAYVERSQDNKEAEKFAYRETEDSFQVDDDGISVRDWDVEGHEDVEANASQRVYRPSSRTPSTEHSSPRQDSIASGTYIPRGAPASEAATGSPPSLRRRGLLDTYRLSLPPSIKLAVPESAARSFPLPQKNDHSLSTAYRPHPAYPVEEWTVPTRGLVRSAREGITTPPLEKRKGLGIAGAELMDVISSTWKRSTSGALASKKTVVSEEPRSVSS